MKYYKIVNPKGHRDMVYKEGLNTDVIPFFPHGDCVSGGIYFSREDILAFLDYGTELYEVEPIGEVYENPGTPKKWKAHEVKLKYVGKVIDNIQMLIDDGADVHSTEDHALRWASIYGLTGIVKILVENGADVHSKTGQALRLASQNGHLGVVKVLVENGANVHVEDEYAIRWSSDKGHLEIVKILLENGADAHAKEDSALSWASKNGHTEVVELLKSYMK